MVPAATPACRRSWDRSLANMAVPSMAMPLVITRLSPSWAPPVRISLSGATSPSIVPMMMGRTMPWVTSLWPPTKLAPTDAQACNIWSNSPSACFSSKPGGTSKVAKNQRGTAPVVATSLALIWTAYQPAWSDTKVTGSLEATKSLSPMSSAAASSPTNGPNTTLGSWIEFLASNFSNKDAGNFPVSITFSMLSALIT